MAEEQKQPEQKKPLIDGAMIGDIMTIVLLGSYSLRRGRLTPNAAMQELMAIGRNLEKSKKVGVSISRGLRSFLPGSDSVSGS